MVRRNGFDGSAFLVDGVPAELFTNRTIRRTVAPAL